MTQAAEVSRGDRVVARPLAGHAFALPAALALVIAALARIVWVLRTDVRDLTFRTTDDSYYYFQVARNVTHGLGWTFDGMHPTNGFHPLWMAILLPVFRLAGDDPVAALRAVQVLQTLLAALTVWVAWRAILGLAGPRAALIAALVTLQPFTLYPLVNGLETGILVLGFLLLFWATRANDLLAPDAGPRRDFALGALIGIVFLARLDSVFLLPSFAIAAAWRAATDRPERRTAAILVRKVLVIAVAFCAVSLPYVLWNLTTFGHLVPISGALKSTFPHPSFVLRRLSSFNTQYGLVLLAASTLLLGWLARSRRGRDDRARDIGLNACSALWGANVLHLAYSLLFVEWGAQWWHYASFLPAALLMAALAFAELDRRTGHRRAVLVAAVAGAALLFGVGIVADHMRRGETRRYWYDKMTWIRGHLPPGAVIGMTDCGFIGYFSGHPVVNLDGVINGYAYQDALRDRSLSRFLASAGVSYIGHHLAQYRDGRCVVRLPARLHHAPGGAIVGTPDAEVYRSAPFPYAPLHPESGMVHAVVWDIRRVRIVDDATALDSLLALPTSRPGS